MSDWWELLTGFQKVYWCFAIPATTFMILQTIMIAMGFGGDDLDFDVEVDSEGDFDGDYDLGVEEGFHITFGIFSVRNLIAFFTFFGWTGIVLSEKALNSILVIFISVIVGFLAMLISFSLFYFMQKMTNDGSISHRSAIGRTGTVYIPVPKKKSGIGKIIVKIQGGSNELVAMTDEEEDIPTNTLIKVVGMVDNRILIVKTAKKKKEL